MKISKIVIHVEGLNLNKTLYSLGLDAQKLSNDFFKMTRENSLNLNIRQFGKQATRISQLGMQMEQIVTHLEQNTFLDANGNIINPNIDCPINRQIELNMNGGNN